MEEDISIVVTINQENKKVYGFNDELCKCEFYYRSLEELRDKLSEFISVCVKIKGGDINDRNK